VVAVVVAETVVGVEAGVRMGVGRILAVMVGRQRRKAEEMVDC